MIEAFILKVTFEQSAYQPLKVEKIMLHNGISLQWHQIFKKLHLNI